MPRNHSGLLSQAKNIQDERDPAIAHDGGTRKNIERLELLLQRLDDDLLRVVDGVHYQAELAVICLENDYVDGAQGTSGREAQLLIEINQRQKIAAQSINRRPVDVLNASSRFVTLQADK